MNDSRRASARRDSLQGILLNLSLLSHNSIAAGTFPLDHILCQIGATMPLYAETRSVR